jgi:FecR protein
VDPSDSRLRELGDAVAEAQDGLRRQRGHVAKTRNAFAHTVATGLAPARRPLAPRARLILLATAALVSTGAAVTAVSVARRPRPLAFVVGPTSEPGRVGAWLAAPPGSELTLAFSDGTALVLEAGARARVVGALERGGRVLIESGRVRVAARPDGSRWSFDAGPLTIEARGARLDLTWDPIDERFATTVFDGAAEVQGDCLSGARPVGPGETLDVSCRKEAPASP